MIPHFWKPIKQVQQIFTTTFNADKHIVSEYSTEEETLWLEAKTKLLPRSLATQTRFLGRGRGEGGEGEGREGREGGGWDEVHFKHFYLFIPRPSNSVENCYGVTIQMKLLWQNLFDSAIYFFGFNSLLFARELRGRKPILLRDYLLSLDLSPA